MHSYKVVVSYDGTDYCGWQWQPKGMSVDRMVRESFLTAFHQQNEEFFLVGASRTDSGVHAFGQVLRIMTKISLPVEKMKWVWNKVLPDDIVIKKIEEVDFDFHPQRNVKYKIYEYTFFTHRPDPTIQRFGAYIPFKLDYQKLGRCLSLFVGTHDFRAFCKEDDEKDTVRTIDSISFKKCERTEGYKIIVKGSSFLRYMIRRIVGAALTAASKISVTENDLKQTLAHKKLFKILTTADPKGLSLQSIEYL